MGGRWATDAGSLLVVQMCAAVPDHRTTQGFSKLSNCANEAVLLMSMDAELGL
jgi:hypothetical protein